MTPDQILQQILSYVVYLVEQIKTWISGVVGQAVTWIQSLMKWLSDLVATIAVQIQTFLAGIFQQMYKLVEDVITTIVGWLQKAWQTIYEATLDVLGSIHAFVQDVAGSIAAYTAEIISTVKGWIASASEAIGGVIDAVVAGVVGVVTTAKDTIQSFVLGIVTAVNTAIDATIATLNGAWAALVTGAESIIKTVGERLVELKTAFGEAATEVVQAISDVGDDTIGPMRDAIARFVDHVLPTADPAQVQAMIAAFEGTRTDPGQMEVFRAWWKDGFRDLSHRSGMYQTVFFFLFTALSLIPSIWGIGQLFTKVSLQEWNARFPSELLPAADVAAAWRHGLLDQKQAVETIQRQGYTDADALRILQITETVPPPADLISLWLRGIIENNGLEDGLKLQGFSALWAQRYRLAAEIIPPVQDLITMGVRDVWTPATRELGRLTENFPPELGEWTKKQGLSPDWALKYWAAHWSLPSPQQGFEMMQRGVITPEQMQVLLQALDVAPGWRQPLTDIAFNVYTRVDIRRMHAMKLLTDAEVLRAHLDIGYDQDKAEKLTAFVLQLNRTSVTEDDVELGKLSRAAILGFYSDGVIKRPTAVKLLQDLGHTLEAATLYLDSIDMEDQRTERKGAADLIIEQAEAGTITFEEAADKLRGLGLETLEVERALTRLLRAAQRKVKLPTQAEGEGFFVKGRIQRAEYEDLLSRLGYAPKWRAAFVAQAEAKKSAGSKSA